MFDNGNKKYTIFILAGHCPSYSEVKTDNCNKLNLYTPFGYLFSSWLKYNSGGSVFSNDLNTSADVFYRVKF